MTSNWKPEFSFSFAGTTQAVDSLPWHPHTVFQGVSLKHLATASQTAGRASFHIVKIEPGCLLAEHVHNGKMELHEVLSGMGTGQVNGMHISYFPGQITLIPDDTPHQVHAGPEGLVLLAKFFPALL